MSTKVDVRREIISKILENVSENKIEFQCRTYLARYLASAISKMQNSPCSASTLLRSNCYSALLDEHLDIGKKVTRRRGTGITFVEKHDGFAVDEFSNALALHNLKKENQRLKHYIAAIETKLAGKDLRPLDKAMIDTNAVQSESTIDLALTCQGLLELVNHFHELVSIDLNSGCLYDRSKLRKSSCVEPRLLQPFFLWLKKNLP